MNKKIRSILCLVLCLSFCLSLAACKRGGDKETTGADLGEKVTYTVRVLNLAEAPLENVGVYIYEDSSMAELVWYDATDVNGEVRFESDQSDSYVAVLDEVPTGYEVEEYYPLTGLETEIVLSAGTMSEEDDITYKLGDMMMDFTVTATDGQEYTLFGLLKDKQAVVLNFYYNGCVPCQMEFPYLQEAYEEYADQIAVLAMNPIDDADAVAQFQKEHGLTFLMAACDVKWEQIMQVSAYPTTVVIDRFGNIVLIHQGSIDSAQTFKDVFAAVTGDDYEQVIYNNITEIETTAELGSVENPDFMGPTPKFELTIEGGKEHYIEFLKLNNLTLQIKDPDAYVIYNGQKYTAKNGVVSLIVTCPDMNTPVKIGFGNSSDKTKTFTVTMASQPGTLDNPYSLVLGENKVNIKAGNELGVYYTWTAKENGALKVWCTSATSGIKYDCVLYNLNSYAQRSLNGEGTKDENGNQYVEVKVNKGDKVQMIAAVLPDESWNYPAGKFTYMAEFTPGAGRDTEKVDMTTYTITVTDAAGKPMANVNFNTVVEEKATSFASNKEGIAAVSLPTGSYKFTMIVPDGYVSEVTEFALTKDAPAYTIKLKTKVIVMVDYTIQVLDPQGQPVVGVAVIIGDQFVYTDEKGKAVFRLEQGEYTVSVDTTRLEGYAVPNDTYAFAQGENTLTVTLEYASGTVNNPIDIKETPYTTDMIAAGKSLYYNLYMAGGMILTIEDTDVSVVVDGQTYTADNTGKITLKVPVTGSPAIPVAMQITNNGTADQTYTLTLSYPVGHKMNPQVLETLGQLDTHLTAGDQDSYYYTWTAAEEGFVTFYVSDATDGVSYDISLTNKTNSANRTLSEDGKEGLVNLNVAVGDVVSIQVMVTSFAAELQEADVSAVGSFTAQENTEDAKLIYSVIVTDEADNAIPGVMVTIGVTNLTTDANGLAFAQLVEGTYTVTITAPEGYKAETAQFTLTKDAPQVNVTLTPVQMVEYSVKIMLDGAVYTGSTKVQILENGVIVHEQVTATGMAYAELPEGNYTVKLTLDSADLTYDAASSVLSTAAPSLNVELQEVIKEVDYTVKVVDAKGTAQSGVLARIQKNGITVIGGTGTTDSNGSVSFKLPSDNYTVNLTFSGTTCYYSKNTAILTPGNTSLTIMLASEVDNNDVTSHWFLEDQNMYNLYEGYTHIKVGAAYPYNKNINGKNICFFVYNPDRAGSFRFVLDNSAVELMIYNTTAWPSFLESSADSETNDVYYSIYEGMQGNFGVVLGVAVTDGATDLGITITRVGNPDFNPNYEPYSEEWMTGATAPQPFSLNISSGEKLTYVDIEATDISKYKAVYNESDGYYHLNGASGPILYINLGTVTKPCGVSVNTIINGEYINNVLVGGGAFQKYFYDEDGTFIKKEKYNDLMNEYINCVDNTYGVYPATKHLVYMIQNGLEYQWTTENGLLLEATKELAWMFGCCYIQ